MLKGTIYKDPFSVDFLSRVAQDGPPIKFNTFSKIM